MIIDLIEANLDVELGPNHNVVPSDDFISTVEATPQWSAHRETLAQTMWTEYLNGV